jgi:hypothetical protein
VRTSQMRYFDSRDSMLGVRHIMASGALPPAFPAVRIDGELYWDGGILSNTPTEAVFDDNPRKNSLIFAVHMWNPSGAEPTTMAEVLNRHKDVQYSSRIASHIARQQQAHRLRHVISELAARLPASERNSDAVKELAGYGCPTRMHVVRLLAPQLDRESHTKDIDFSRPASDSAGTPDMPIPGRFSIALPGAASSIRSRALFFTSRWKSCPPRPHDGPPRRMSAIGHLADIRSLANAILRFRLRAEGIFAASCVSTVTDIWLPANSSRLLRSRLPKLSLGR